MNNRILFLMAGVVILACAVVVPVSFAQDASGAQGSSANANDGSMSTGSSDPFGAPVNAPVVADQAPAAVVPPAVAEAPVVVPPAPPAPVVQEPAVKPGAHAQGPKGSVVKQSASKPAVSVPKSTLSHHTVDDVISKINQTKNGLAGLGSDPGGHVSKAIEYLDQAIQELGYKRN